MAQTANECTYYAFGELIRFAVDSADAITRPSAGSALDIDQIAKIAWIGIADRLHICRNAMVAESRIREYAARRKLDHETLQRDARKLFGPNGALVDPRDDDIQTMLKSAAQHIVWMRMHIADDRYFKIAVWLRDRAEFLFQDPTTPFTAPDWMPAIPVIELPR